MNQKTENTSNKLISPDGTMLFVQSWKPAKMVQAVVALVHGLGEHSGRWSYWAGKFCEQNVAVVAIDLRGHGNSGGKRGHAASYETLMKDLEVLINEATKQFPNVPIILYGHSMGGNLALNYVLKYNPPIKACIITSPWLKLSFEVPKLKLLTGRIVKCIYPSFSQPSGLVATHLCRNNVVVNQYLNDPLVHNKISITLFSSVYSNGLRAIDHAGKLDVPCLIMHGQDDKLTSPSGSEEFSKGNPLKVNLKIWDGAFHELHNEPEKDEVFSFMFNWLKIYLA